MDTTTPKEPRLASDVLAEFERQTAANTPFDKETNDRLAKLEAETDAAMADPNGKPLENASFKFDPNDPAFQRMVRKALKAQYANAPKHENCKECRKFCPLFKKNECFKKTTVEQKACWDAYVAKAKEVGGIVSGEYSEVENNRRVGSWITAPF